MDAFDSWLVWTHSDEEGRCSYKVSSIFPAPRHGDSKRSLRRRQDLLNDGQCQCLFRDFILCKRYTALLPS